MCMIFQHCKYGMSSSTIVKKYVRKYTLQYSITKFILELGTAQEVRVAAVQLLLMDFIWRCG